MPACVNDYAEADNPVRLIRAFVDELDLAALGFERAHISRVWRLPTSARASRLDGRVAKVLDRRDGAHAHQA